MLIYSAWASVLFCLEILFSLENIELVFAFKFFSNFQFLVKLCYIYHD